MLEHHAHRPLPDLRRIPATSCHLAILSSDPASEIPGAVQQVAHSCDCASVDVCGLFVDPTLLPSTDDIKLDVRQVRAPNQTA
jgi:hypothetical protein